MAPLAFRLVPYGPHFHYTILLQGTTSREIWGSIYITKEVRQPLQKQHRKSIALLFSPVAICSYSQLPQSVNVSTLRLFPPVDE